MFRICSKTRTISLVLLAVLSFYPLMNTQAQNIEERRANLFDNLDYNALSNKISQWLRKDNESSAVLNVTIESERSVLNDFSDLLSSSFRSNSQGTSEDFIIKFYWSSTEIGRGGLTTICVLNIQYDRSTIVLDNCQFIDNVVKDLTTWEWLTAARDDQALVKPLSTKSERVSEQTNLVVRFNEILRQGGTSASTCDENSTNDFTILIVTGSEKEPFLSHAKTTFISRRLNYYGNKCFGIRVEKGGSVSSATDMKLKQLARNENGSTIYPTIWTPASKIYENYAFGNNPNSRFIDGDPIVISPMVFLLKKRHLEEGLADVVHENLNLVIGDQNAAMFQPLARANFVENPTNIGMTDVLFRSTEDLIKVKRRGSYKFQTTPPASSNSGHHYQVIQALEFATIISGGDPLQDLDYNISPEIINSADLATLITESANRTRTQYESTDDLGKAMVTQSGIDGAYLYENVAIESVLSLPESEQNKYEIVYPINNSESNHPAYILRNTATPEQIAAAKIFIDFLRTREMQLLAMGSYGFRPLKTSLEGSDGDLLSQNFGALENKLGVISDLEAEELNFISVPPAGLIERIIDLVN